MKSLLALAVCGVAATGCSKFDSAFGGSDNELVAARIADDQPSVPAHGVLVNVEARISDTDRLLGVSVRYGTVERAGSTAAETSFCQKATSTESWIVPLIVIPAEDEAVLDVRLLEGSDATSCEGTTIDSIFVPIAARPGTMTPDAGVPDAS